ncbi:MAG: imidazolonepropionase [Tissierellaceae bacterium]
MRNIVIKNAKEIVTSTGFNKKAGEEMKNIGIIEDGSIIITDGIIEKVGKTKDIFKDFDTEDYEIIDASGRSVLPGFVDSHTHFIFAGYREEEFNLRLQGATYMEIMNSGGGISGTVQATRDATREELFELGKKRLNSMMEFGVTTVEGKSGYGLETATELKQLEVMRELDQKHPVDVVRTYMGAHDIPKEYKGRTDDFIDYLIKDGLPQVKERELAEFCDIFTEENVFSIEQSRKLLLKARDMGFKLKMHADEIVQLGGSELAAELEVVSADHLLQASDRGLSAMKDKGVIATLLPCTAFSLKEDYARARYIIDNGGAVALATDYNPGSSYTNSIPLLIALATIYMGMSIEEVITALTINGAAAVDRVDTIGSIDIGKKGDIIILDAPSYKFLSYNIAVNLVKTVIKDGKVVLNRD